ncbi:MAG: hypothetical protein AB1611_07985 [bacterium]
MIKKQESGVRSQEPGARRVVSDQWSVKTVVSDQWPVVSKDSCRNQ